MASAATPGSPYVTITADTHAGASVDAYRDYLDPALSEATSTNGAVATSNPSKEHIGGKKTKNWDSAGAPARSRGETASWPR